MDEKVTMRKFSGKQEDFRAWKRSFMAAMTIKGLSGILLTDKDPEPTEPDNADETAKEAHKINLLKYTEQNVKLFAYLCLTVDDRTAGILESKCNRDGWQAWQVINEIFERKDLLRMANLRIELGNVRLDEGGDMDEYLATISTLCRLIAEGEKTVMSEGAIVTAILKGLPPSYKQWIYSKTSNAAHKLEDIEAELRAISSFEKEYSKQSEDTEVGFGTFQQGKHKGTSWKRFSSGKKDSDRGHGFKNSKESTRSDRHRDKECYNCGKMGHISADCWSKRSTNNRQDFRRKTERRFGQSANTADDDIIFMVHERKLDKESASTTTESSTWIVDSGATTHMCNERRSFKKFKEDTIPNFIEVANGEQVQVIGRGSITLTTIDSRGDKTRFTLDDVLFIPQLKKNLMSIRSVVAKGHKAKFDQTGGVIDISGKGERFINIKTTGKLYTLSCTIDYEKDMSANCNEEANTTSNKKLVINLWHERLEHLNKDMIERLETSVEGLHISEDGKRDKSPCSVCVTTKLTKKPFTSSTRRATAPLQLVHTDLTGPVRTATFLGGHKYAMIFVDDYSRFTRLYTMKFKSQALDKMKQFIADVGRPKELSIEALRSDNGGEFISNKFVKFCRDKGIRRELTIPRTSEQNGVAERYLRTIFGMTRSMLRNASLTDGWWGTGATTATYIKNRTLTSANKDNKTPYELFTGKKPDLSNMRTFGCKVYAYNDSKSRGKLDDRAIEGIFLGYGDQTKGYLVYLKEARKVIISRSVVFFEHVKEKNSEDLVEFDISEELRETPKLLDTNEPLEPQTTMPDLESHPIQSEPEDNEPTNQPSEPEIEAEMESEPDDETAPNTARNNEKQPPIPRRSARGLIPKKKWPETNIAEEQEYAFITNLLENGEYDLNTPRTYKDAIKSEKWKKAMQEEYDGLIKNETWILTDLPKGRKPIDSKWTFKLKQNSDGSVARYKARLVAKGFTQKEGVDFNQTYAPVAKFTTIRTLLAFAAIRGYSVKQADISTAFLHAEVNEELYMKQPEGFEIHREGQEFVCKLLKSLYGLRQAGRNWNRKLDKWMKANNMKVSGADPCLYILKTNDPNKFLAFVTWVDDLISVDSGNGI